MNYQNFFEQVTGFLPYPWQERFSVWSGKPVAVVSAPAEKESEQLFPALPPTKLVFPQQRGWHAHSTRSLVIRSKENRS